MLTLQSYPLQDPESAVAFLQQTMEGQERLFLQMEVATKEMRVSHDPSRFLFTRYNLMEYMSAAYAIQSRDGFVDAVDCLMAHPLPKNEHWFLPRAAQLGFDLSVALSCQRDEPVHDLAARLLRSEPEADAAPEDLQAHVLALLADLDFHKADRMIDRLRAAIGAADRSRHEINVLSAWAGAAESVAARSDVTLQGNLQKITRLRSARADKQLSRWCKGSNTDLTALDFWDGHTTALTAVASSLGMGSGLSPDAIAFANCQWTRGIQVWA